MKEKGEATLFAILALVSITGIMLLCSLELARSFQLLRKRTHLFLCTKEAKGELNRHLTLMGRTNWAIKNVDRAKWIMAFIPGLQGATAKAQKVRQVLIHYQNVSLPLYLNKLSQLARRKCKNDPRMFLTPYELGAQGLIRDHHGRAKPRKQKWTYYFSEPPYVLSIQIDISGHERMTPKILYEGQEKGVRSFSPLPFAY